jgi:peptidyl-prolyl cis-trans isomerase C
MRHTSTRFWMSGALLLGLGTGLVACGDNDATGRKQGSPPASPDGSRVLAVVGDYPITEKQVETRIRESTKNEESQATNLQNPDIVQIALSALIDQVVWAKAAEDAGYDKNLQIERDAYMYKTQLLATAYLADRIEKEAEPSEEEVVEFYEKNKHNFVKPVRIAARHIQVSSREKAEDLLKQLLLGAEFQSLAKAHSEDANTRDIGGALGFVSLQDGALGIGRDPQFLGEALKLRKDELSKVIQSSKGFHIVYCESREGGDEIPLEEVRDEVVRRIKVGGKLADVYNSRLSEARRKYKAEIFEAQVDAMTGVSDSAKRLWEVVEMQPNDRGQIEVLRRITFDFPHDDLADDAQLKIAYIYALKLKEPKRAEKALTNLKSRFPRSELIGAADWLLSRLKEAEIDVHSFDELKLKSQKS